MTDVDISVRIVPRLLRARDREIHRCARASALDEIARGRNSFAVIEKLIDDGYQRTILLFCTTARFILRQRQYTVRCM